MNIIIIFITEEKREIRDYYTFETCQRIPYKNRNWTEKTKTKTLEQNYITVKLLKHEEPNARINL